MKYLLRSLILILSLYGHRVLAQNPEQDRLDLPGDNLNLYAVLKLFQESPTLEGFERSLNSESNNINNLDLNGDGRIDYIQVVDDVRGNIHNIVLKVAVSATEEQNVAVIIVQREPDGQARIQIVGDEDLYGKNYIVEPNYSSNNQAGETPNPGYSGQLPLADAGTTVIDQQPVTVQYTTTYQVGAWPIVLFMFRPVYVVWRSPWYWGYYPSYWRPWRPWYWHQYYGFHYYWDYWYFGHYRRWNYYRFPGWYNGYYGPRGFRQRAPIVYTRITRGYYNTTYSRPDLSRVGGNIFRKDFPKAPSIHNKPPTFDKNGRPQITRPARPGGTIQPITRPGGGTTRPGGGTTRPVNPGARPGEGTARPGGTTRPANPGGTTRPGGGTTRPVNPGTRPGEGTTRPGGTTRPEGGTTRPANPGGTTRPQSHPNPGGTVRPAQPSRPFQPATRPAQPAPRPQPATRPSQPTPRPTQPVRQPSQPVIRPAQPVRPAAPATRPAPRPPAPAPRPAPQHPQRPGST